MYLPSCHSTNDIARNLVKNANVIEGTLVITNDQTAGRGQMGNSWESEPQKNLTFSLVLRPKFIRLDQQFQMTMCTSLGIVDYLNNIKQGFEVKWPNDIYFGTQKVAGILIQNLVNRGSLENSIIGVGLNVNQQEFSYSHAISLSSILGKELSLPAVLEELCHSIERRYLQLKSGRTHRIKQDYLQNLLGFNHERTFLGETHFRGVIIAVLDSGHLIVNQDNEQRAYNFKEIQFQF